MKASTANEIPLFPADPIPKDEMWVREIKGAYIVTGIAIAKTQLIVVC